MTLAQQFLKIGWQVAISALLMWISGRVSFEIPGLSVPITLQSMFAILLPLSLNSRYASGGIILWLLLGALGLPLFADGNGGHSYFFSNSGGYLLGFYIIAIMAGKAKKLFTPNPIRVSVLFISMHFLLMIIGLSWIWIGSYSIITFETHIIPYLPGMIVKCVIGTLLFVLYSETFSNWKNFGN